MDPTPGGIVWLSKTTHGNYYLTKKTSYRAFFIVNDTNKLRLIRICVAPTTDWWTTVLNKQCENFIYPSSEISIFDVDQIFYDNYSSGRCDAVVPLKPAATLMLKILPRLHAAGGKWEEVNN